MKTRQLYIEKYKKPYPASKNPSLGYNGLYWLQGLIRKELKCPPEGLSRLME